MVRLTPEGDGRYNVEVPDLPGCLTWGENIDEALDMAREAMDGWLAVQLTRNRPVPPPTVINGDNARVGYVRPSPGVAVPVWLRMKRESLGMTQTDVAHLLGVSQQTYARFEDVDSANPRLSTLIKLQEIFEEQIIAV